MDESDVINWLDRKLAIYEKFRLDVFGALCLSVTSQQNKAIHKALEDVEEALEQLSE